MHDSCARLGQNAVGPLDTSRGDPNKEGLSGSDEGRNSMGTGMTEELVWQVVREYAAAAGIASLAP